MLIRIFAHSLFIIILFSANELFARDYTDYHKAINKAEGYIFLQNKIDSGLILYDKIFAEFDFVYAGDCITAMQMALYNNNEEAFLSFTKKAFQNGLMLRNFKKIYYIKKHALYLKDTLRFEALYRNNRSHYLKRIDTAVLKKMYYLKVDDQLNKNGLKNIKESRESYEKRYKPILTNVVKRLNEIVSDKGIPLDRIIGIDQKDIMKELKLSCPDLEEFYWKNKNSSSTFISLDQFQIQEWLLFSHFYFPIMIHSQNIMRKFDDSAGFLKQLRLGNIHPKDIAFFYDNFNGYNNSFNPLYKENTCFYGVGVRPSKMYKDALFVPDALINKCRAGIYLPPIEQDRAKWKFMESNKMNYGWGYTGVRS
jgi:hypothetical protein